MGTRCPGALSVEGPAHSYGRAFLCSSKQADSRQGQIPAGAKAPAP